MRGARFAAISAALVSLVTANDCQVPPTWGPYVVSDCGAPGDTISDSSICNLSCVQPSDQYEASAADAVVTCTAGTLSPSDFACKPIAPLETLEVWCGDGAQVYLNGYTYISTTDTCSTLKTWCNQGVALTIQTAAVDPSSVESCCADASANTCSGQEFSELACALPINFGDSIVGDSTNPPECFNGYALFPTTTCTVNCANGPAADPSSVPGVYSCSTSAILSPPAPAIVCPSSDQCAISRNFNGNVTEGTCTSDVLDINTFCTVECASGFVRDAGDDTYNCLPNIMGGPPYLERSVNLTCKPAPCLLPTIGNFGPNIDPFLCTPASLLAGEGSNSSCQVRCYAGFEPVPGGSDRYNCSFGVRQNATLQCRAVAPVCPLPPGVQCQSGTLSPGGFCSVKCSRGFKPRNTAISNVYRCSANGAVTGTFTCIPNSSCVVPSFNSISSTCPAGSVVSANTACTIRCGGSNGQNGGYNSNNNALYGNRKTSSGGGRTGRHAGLTGTSIYTCVNGALRLTSGRGCPTSPRPTPYCIGPHGRKLAFNIRYSYSSGIGACAKFRGQTLVWCSNRGQHPVAYCCGTICGINPGAGFYGQRSGCYGFFDRTGQHVGYYAWSPKKPAYVFLSGSSTSGQRPVTRPSG